MSLSNGSGGRSNTRKSTCAPTEASRRRVAVLVAIWRSTTGADRIHRLAGKRPIKPISTSQRQARRRHNQRGDPLIDSSQPVQNSPATSTLDWLIGLTQPTTYAFYDSVFLPIIPSANERQAIITALQMHHLVMHDEVSNVITVTPKGREYQEWRGVLPPLTRKSTRR